MKWFLFNKVWVIITEVTLNTNKNRKMQMSPTHLRHTGPIEAESVPETPYKRVISTAKNHVHISSTHRCESVILKV